MPMHDPSETTHFDARFPWAPRFSRAAVLTIVTAIICSITYVAIGDAMNELARRTVVIFVFAAIFWATEAIPLYATSLLTIVLSVLLLASDGGATEMGEIKAAAFLTPFGSDVIMLFLGGLLLSAAVTKHGLDSAIAARMLNPFMHRPMRLLFAVLLVSAFFSMWMSNTATAAMMLAITAPLLRQLPKGERFQTALVLAVPFGANIGGIGTPIGTPPNAIALAALRSHGIPVSFLDWMIMAVPLAIVMLVVCGLLLYVLNRPSRGLKMIPEASPESITGKGWTTLVILVLTVIAWLTAPLHGVSDGVIALSAGALLACTGTLERRDVDTIDWSVLILMWGGLALGRAMALTGLVDQVTNLPLAQLSGIILAGLCVAVGILLSTFMSNTAAAALLVPFVFALATADRSLIVVLVALSASFAMAMPVSTPPNALAFASGRIAVKDMIRTGTLIGLIAVVVMMLGYRVMIPLALP